MKAGTSSVIYTLCLSLFLFGASTLFTYAQSPQSPQSFSDLVDILLGIIQLLIPLILGLAFIVFLWGIMQAWIIGGTSEENVTKGKNIALWGVIAFAVGSGVWGIVALLRSSLF